ncbi:response regulator transcription factor [Pontibacter silvestris]|uniref:Response regulator transcription factor n=1 Tax=Pontibacter silvestris TaxID=2305183 RepID=A0ABW4X320_9BACT|nr:LuxR C-terminal-related transcriptional regulator [Pontibacter silvestris]MCC9135096.1 LuxR C-terminal-related transcriptional regulator [Pontibacter silvestris]
MNRNEKLLNEQECEIIMLLADGLTNKQIGEVFGVTEKAVEVSLQNMLNKLDRKHPNEMITWAYLGGVLK